MELDCNVTRRVDTRRRVEVATGDNAVQGLDYDVGTSEVDGEDLGDIDDLDEHATGGRTIFEANGMVPDIPQQKDLNNISTVLSLSRYALGISKRMLADEDEDMDELWANYTEPPEPIMKQTGPALLGDGSPTFAALKLKYTKLKDTLWVVFGGFHLLLEAHKKRGGLFGMTHLRSIIHPWRPSDKQKDWVMNPGDPNQIDDESVPMYYAAYAAATLELIKSRRANGMLEDEANNITAVDVYQYTQQVEQSKPVARIIMMDLRFLEVIFLLHHAEESGEAKYLVCSVKFLLLLCAFTHATKYVFMLVKFMIWWLCGSEAEKTIFEKGLMVQKTVSGKTVFSDRMFEWIQRMLRARVGKNFTQGFHKRLTQHTLQLDDKSLFKFLVNEEHNRAPSNTGEPTHDLRFGKVYCESLKWFIDKDIWKLNGDNTLDSLISNNGKTHVNPEVLRLPSIAEERVQSYFRNYESADGSDTHGERSDTIVDLSAIQPTLEKRTKQDAAHRTRLTSTLVELVTKSYSAAELEQEYSNLRTEFNINDIDVSFPPLRGGKNKAHYAQAICSARQILIDNVTNWNELRLTAFNNGVEARNNNERTELDQEYTDSICGGVFVNLGVNSEKGRRICSRYNNAKYDMSKLALVQPRDESGDADEDVSMEGNGDENGGGNANNNGQDGALLSAETVAALGNLSL